MVDSEDEAKIFECEICDHVEKEKDEIESHLFEIHSISEKFEENYERISRQKYKRDRKLKFSKIGSTHCKICDKTFKRSTLDYQIDVTHFFSRNDVQVYEVKLF